MEGVYTDEILESRRLDAYGNHPDNYLVDWARRNGHLADMAAFTVQVTQDEGGLFTGHIRAMAPEVAPEPAAPAELSAEEKLWQERFKMNNPA